MSLLKRYREISSRHSPLGGRAFARSPPNVAPRTRLPISLRFLHSQDTRSVPLQPSTFSTYEASQAPRHCLIIRQHQIPTFAGPPVPTFTRSQVSKLQDSQAARFLDSHGSQAGSDGSHIIGSSCLSQALRFKVGGSQGRLRAQRAGRPLERPPSPLTPVPCETEVRRGRARYLTLLRQNCLRSAPRP